MTARKVLRTVVEAFRAEFGKPEKRRNRWPICVAGQHRVPPPLCGACRRCDFCCQKCERCDLCLLRCEGHEKETSK